MVFYVDDSTSMTTDEKIYQYFLDSSVDFEVGSSFSSEYMEITDSFGDKLEADKTPFYSYDHDRIYLPRNYGWYNINGTSYRIPEFTRIDNSGNGVYTCNYKNNNYIIGGGFLFDASYNFVFLENGFIEVNGNRHDVSPLSFFSQDYGAIRIYNYGEKNFELIQDAVGEITYNSNAGYRIVLNRGLFQAVNGEQYLIVSSPELLTSIEEKING